MSDERTPQPEPYDPPQFEEIPSGDGPVVTAAGKSPPPDAGPEWQPSESETR